MNLCKSTVLELYDMEIHQKISVPNYQKLKTIVKRDIDQKLRLRNIDARHGGSGTGAVIKNRRGMSAVEGGKSICYQWKEKASVRKETVAGSPAIPKIVRKNQNTLPPPFPSQPHHEIEVSRKRSIRGKK